LQYLECPLSMPQYSVELGWRAESQRDPGIQRLKALIVDTFNEAPFAPTDAP
jgi:hypothetical protein